MPTRVAMTIDGMLYMMTTTWFLSCTCCEALQARLFKSGNEEVEDVKGRQALYLSL